ncbi:flavin reductase family protein [Acetobacterium bakii]|uniref:Flavoredoxin n=1 Tax=Acetobacterium bakii TaxID=52689 RepID=A0A0L6TXD0_9FIRM|nr:flavin reductase family protein [Acetobacterium bakii]KNZ40919.1 flavoredoxin [Acetobacterium bakii]
MKKSIGPKTFAMPSPVWVVGTYGEDDQPNIMTAAWGGICCSVPPCVTISLQKPRATYDNILKRKAFTISIPSSKHAVEADYVGIAGGKNADKFEVTGLTPVKSELVDAPYVEEFPLILECRLVQTVELGIHTQFIGEIIDVKADLDVLNEKGVPSLERVSPFVFSASDKGYYTIGEQLGQAFSIGMKHKDK